MSRRASKPILVYLSTETIGKEVFNILKLSQNFMHAFLNKQTIIGLKSIDSNPILFYILSIILLNYMRITQE